MDLAKELHLTLPVLAGGTSIAYKSRSPWVPSRRLPSRPFTGLPRGSFVASLALSLGSISTPLKTTCFSSITSFTAPPSAPRQRATAKPRAP